MSRNNSIRQNPTPPESSRRDYAQDASRSSSSTSDAANRQNHTPDANRQTYTPETRRRQRYTQDAKHQIHPPDATNATSAAPQDFVWGDQTYTLRDFVSKHKLPAMARILKSAGDSPLDFLLPPASKSQQQQQHQQQQQQQQQLGSLGQLGATPSPSQWQGECLVRIHEVGKRRVVLARRVQWDKRQHDYVVSGDQVDIPAPFKGWFEAVPEDGRAVAYCDTVAALCVDKPRQFLVRTPTVVYRLCAEEQGASCWMPHEIKAGEVLATGAIYDHMPNIKKNKANATTNTGTDSDRASRAAEKGKKSNRSRSVSPGRSLLRRLLKPSRSKQKEEQEYKYLQCFDAQSKEVTVPLATTGVFSPVGDPTLASYDAVYQLHDLILAFGMPVNAQLTHSIPADRNLCPQGVLRLYGTREEEMAVISRLELQNDDLAESKRAEVSIDRHLQLQLGRRKSKKNGQTELSTPKINPKTDAAPFHSDKHEKPTTSHAEIPKSVSKELKKFKSTGILDKLSVRAMRKERSKTRENGPANSKQVAHHGLCYEDFFNGLDKPDTQTEAKAQTDNALVGRPDQSAEKTQLHSFPQDSPHESSGSNDTHASSTNEARRTSLQNRDLPPIPRRIPLSPATQDGSSKGSKDSLYEHLPPAPSPPSHHRSGSGSVRSERRDDYNLVENNDHGDNKDYDDDGYMVPSDFPGADTAYSVNGHVQMRHRSPQASDHQSGKASVRLKKCHSELFPADLHSGVIATDDGWPLDIDQLFSATYSKKSQGLYGGGALKTSPPWTGSSSQLYDLHSRKAARASAAVTAWRDDVERHQDNSHHRHHQHPHPHHHPHLTSMVAGDISSLDRRRKSVERLDLETLPPFSSAGGPGRRCGGRGAGNGSGSSHRHHHHANSAHATIRSHNLRHPKASLLELFHFGDAFQDVAADPQSASMAPPSGSAPSLHEGCSSLPPEGCSSLPPEGCSSTPGVTQSVKPPSPFPSMSIARIGGRGRRTSYGEAMTSPLAALASSKDYYYSRPRHSAYAESEPTMFHGVYPHHHHHHHHTTPPSLSALSDSAYPKQGDDSAISVGSRERERDDPYGGFATTTNGDSDQLGFHYNDADSGGTLTSLEDGRCWSPPGDISGLTVQEVSRSLRYIGMKDRVVLRFANEQIDGSMLGSLDKRHLKEGFPELNALEVKKILDFVHGWRPKKQ